MRVWWDSLLGSSSWVEKLCPGDGNLKIDPHKGDLGGVVGATAEELGGGIRRHKAIINVLLRALGRRLREFLHGDPGLGVEVNRRLGGRMKDDVGAF